MISGSLLRILAGGALTMRLGGLEANLLIRIVGIRLQYVEDVKFC